MADSKHLEVAAQGSASWNAWRHANPDVTPDLSGADLGGRRDFSRADFRNANLKGTSFRKANLNQANFSYANLTSANLHRVHADGALFRNATLIDTQFDVRSCIDAEFHGALIKNIVLQTNTVISDLFGLSVLALAEAKGLDELSPESAPFVNEFVGHVFRFVENLQLPQSVKFTRYGPSPDGRSSVPIGPSEDRFWQPGSYDINYVEGLLDRIALLKRIYFRNEEPEIIETVSTVNIALIEYLRKNPREIDNLHWRTFEELIAELLSNFGWEVQLTQPSKDNGYDILGIHRDISGVAHSWIVECKHWRKMRKVGVTVAHSLYTVKNELKVGGAMIATTSTVTRGVRKFQSSRYDFDVRDSQAIIEWLAKYKK